MLDLVLANNYIPRMNENALDKVREIEKIVLQAPQVNIGTTHTLHGGVYTRTIMIPEGIVLTGAIVKIPTTLIIAGDVAVYVGDKTLHLKGYNVLAAGANRKQAFVAYADTYVTMIFRTDMETVAEAEAQFTDDAPLLMSRHTDALNNFIITGE